MNDDQLTQAGVNKFGDRVALRAFLNSTQPSEESHAQPDIVAQIKHHMAANNMMGLKNSKKKQLGNKNSAKHKFRIVNIGWLMDDCDCDEEYNMSLSNFDGTIIEDESQTIEEVIEQHRLPKVQLYLYSKLRDNSSSDNPSVMTPRQSSWTAPSMSTPVSNVNEESSDNPSVTTSRQSSWKAPSMTTPVSNVNEDVSISIGFIRHKREITQKAYSTTENTVLKVQIDTGADVNILPTRCYSQIFQDANFSRASPSKANLTAYAGSTIRHHETISIPCSLRTAPGEFEIEFYICDSNGPALLGHQDAIRLKMISENKKHGHRCKDHCHSETGTATNQRPGSPHVPIPEQLQGPRQVSW
ncbi:hypothetical protein CAPTEDRAFT_204875 [Capitella teleta]|uniref:Uncharacterized protein n=1 Tax=Capitella teleta TaxID=283909 RepID=R7TID1_CAPTE|nr:hypothetical protein CAPTEDRAFT_204875 [Capitella teleta]|eukprot:ELT93494.1 hypothetical protein CAPTEDRAFT_204875 [Capitella teleta]